MIFSATSLRIRIASQKTVYRRFPHGRYANRKCIPADKTKRSGISSRSALAAACRCRRRTRLQIQTFDFSCRYFLCLCDHIARHSVQMKNLLPIQIIFLFIMANEARLCMCPPFLHFGIFIHLFQICFIITANVLIVAEHLSAINKNCVIAAIS